MNWSLGFPRCPAMRAIRGNPSSTCHQVCLAFGLNIPNLTYPNKAVWKAWNQVYLQILANYLVFGSGSAFPIPIRIQIQESQNQCGSGSKTLSPPPPFWILRSNVAEPEPGAAGAEIPSPTGVAAVIMNYVSGSLLFFIKDLKKFCWKNIQFYNFNFIYLIKSAEKSFFRLIRQSRRWIQSRKSDNSEPESKIIFSDPQNC
jgi:hypothetical protein